MNEILFSYYSALVLVGAPAPSCLFFSRFLNYFSLFSQSQSHWLMGGLELYVCMYLYLCVLRANGHFYAFFKTALPPPIDICSPLLRFFAFCLFTKLVNPSISLCRSAHYLHLYCPVLELDLSLLASSVYTPLTKRNKNNNSKVRNQGLHKFFSLMIFFLFPTSGSYTVAAAIS